jgi:hypothetical protein
LRELGAFEDEMAFVQKISDAELEALLEGDPPEGGPLEVGDRFEDLATFLAEVRHRDDPDEMTRARHMAMLSKVLGEKRRAERLRSSPVESLRLLQMAKRTALTSALVIAAVTTSLIVLGYAGVNLPGRGIEVVIERLTGLHLPNQENQGSDQSHNQVGLDDAVRQVLGGDDSGCDLGQSVAAVASEGQGESGPPLDPCEQQDVGRADEKDPKPDDRHGREKADSKEERGEESENVDSGRGRGFGKERVIKDAGETAQGPGDAVDDPRSEKLPKKPKTQKSGEAEADEVGDPAE